MENTRNASSFTEILFAETKSVKGAKIVTKASRIGMAKISVGLNHLKHLTFKSLFESLPRLNCSEIVKYESLPLKASVNNLNNIDELKQEVISWFNVYI